MSSPIDYLIGGQKHFGVPGGAEALTAAQISTQRCDSSSLFGNALNQEFRLTSES
jgi:hypothetical protein